jgi:hypothetical protein
MPDSNQQENNDAIRLRAHNISVINNFVRLKLLNRKAAIDIDCETGELILMVPESGNIIFGDSTIPKSNTYNCLRIVSTGD